MIYYNPPTTQPSLKRYAAIKITEKPRFHHHKDFMASVYTPVQKVSVSPGAPGITVTNNR